MTKLYGVLISFFVSAMCFAQDAAQATGIDKAGGVVDSITAILTSYAGTSVTVGSFVLVFIAKFFSTEKAYPVIAQIQYLVDGVATLIVKVGALLHKVAEIMGDIMKSDGIAGKK